MVSTTGQISTTGPASSSANRSPDAIPTSIHGTIQDDLCDSIRSSDSSRSCGSDAACDTLGITDQDRISSLPLALHQGDTIRLPDDGSIRLPRTSQQEGSLYQVIAVDAGHDRCWIRSWPLTRHGSPVFEISLQQAQRHGTHRPVIQRPSP